MNTYCNFILLIILFSFQVHTQSLSLFEIDTTRFPTMQAKFFLYDSSRKQINNVNISEIKVSENGIDRTVATVSCSPGKPSQRLSSVIVADVSGSMMGTPLDITRMVGKTWVNALPLGQSECALSSFDNYNYFNQDFTTNRNKLLTAIDGIGHGGGTDYNMAMIEPVAGGLLVAKTGKYKKVIIFLTDGQPNFPPDEARIIAAAQANNIIINCITIGLTADISMRHFSEQTGGLCFDNVTTEKQAKEITEMILSKSLDDGDPCEITWQSGVSCVSKLTNVNVKYIPLNLSANASYQSPNSSVAILEIKPSSVRFIHAMPGIKRDTTITVTARNADFDITNIISTNAAFVINPINFKLKAGQSIKLTLSFVPPDSGYVYTSMEIENNLCPKKLSASGGYPGKRPTIKTIKLIEPNGGESLVVGMDTVITWTGVLPEENVKLEYSTDSGVNWITIAQNTKGLSYNWRVPQTPSNHCLMRVTAKSQYSYDSGEVQICNQVWMTRNLEVETYCNGDTIPEVTDPSAWSKLTTGAWCYYNNDPAMGEIYGKLYNWYAVNDPRGLAPLGWHIPSDEEWKVLEMCLGMSVKEVEKIDQWRGRNEGGKLKCTGTFEGGDGLWYSPNTDATNITGFSINPGGSRSILSNWNYDRLHWNCHFWTSTEFYSRHFAHDLGSIGRYISNKSNGYTIRCVKD